MGKTLKFLILPVLFIWELQQNLLGLLVYASFKIQKKILNVELEDHHFVFETQKTGVSLGWFIFWISNGNRFPHLKNDCRMHEFGHSKQSTMLGPVYLFVVGIPSLLRVIYGKWYYKKNSIRWKNYYSAFPENWADKLGSVKYPKRNDS
jgi:hypothetical protein